MPLLSWSNAPVWPVYPFFHFERLVDGLLTGHISISLVHSAGFWALVYGPDCYAVPRLNLHSWTANIVAVDTFVTSECVVVRDALFQGIYEGCNCYMYGVDVNAYVRCECTICKLIEKRKCSIHHWVLIITPNWGMLVLCLNIIAKNAESAYKQGHVTSSSSRLPRIERRAWSTLSAHVRDLFPMGK